MEYHFIYVVVGFLGIGVQGGFGVLVYWGIDAIEYLVMFPSYLGCVYTY